MGIKLGEEIGIVVGGAKEETVVHVALLGCKGELLFQSLQCRSLRHRIGHIEIGGDTSSGSGTALGIDVRLLRQTWLTEMYVVVDDAWEHKTTRSVDDLVIRRFGRMVSFYNLSDSFVFNDQRAIECPAFVDKRSPFDQRRHFCGRLSDGNCRESGVVCGATGCWAVWAGTSSSTRPF